jgi:hypothetical protein
LSRPSIGAPPPHLRARRLRKNVATLPWALHGIEHLMEVGKSHRLVARSVALSQGQWRSRAVVGVVLAFSLIGIVVSLAIAHFGVDIGLGG